MFQKKTVFIVGAGCSAELDMPLGPGLIHGIYQSLSGAKADQHGLIQHAMSITSIPGMNENINRRMRSFADGLYSSPSIDQYLDFHKDDPLKVMLGKIAIATEILNGEANSDLGNRSTDKAVPDCWLTRLFHLLQPGTNINDPTRIFDNISFVCFNYDRIIELLLLRLVQGLLHSSYEKAASIVEAVPIWHPYGQVGGFRLGDVGMSRTSLSFDIDRVDAYGIVDAAKRLRTFTEGINDGPETAAIRSDLKAAQQIVFLGFSYIEQNMSLLSVSPIGTRAKTFGTVYNMSESEIGVIKGLLSQAFGNENGPSYADYSATFIDAKASKFLQDRGRALKS